MRDVTNLEDVVVYSMRLDGDTNLVTNFKVKEFACQDGTDVILLHPYIPFICQLVRNKFNMPFTPNSGYRTVSHNANVKGVKNSNHIYGLAVDIPAKNGVTPKQIYDYLDALFGNWGELGIYSWGVHVGVQNKKSRFKG